MNNKQIGTSFEKEFCELLAARGFWVHFMSPSASGAQPCDIIACKNSMAFLFDCKTCESGVFRLSRLENNQCLAFERFIKTGNITAYLAIKHNKKIYIVPYEILKKMTKVYLLEDFLMEKWSFMQ